MLPSEFPKWRTVHAYFSKWSELGPDGESALERVLKNVVGVARTKQESTSSTSFLIVDAQSVKNTDGANAKGYDAGKKVSGIKRNIAVDTQGFPHAIAVTTADVMDRKGALLASGRCAAELRQVQCILADDGY
jgi:hypothetical protein